ncbi:MAG TPA: BatA domain-containing protein [Gemmatimonadaceae bacterium]|jgi:hypothetical protein
MTWLVPSALAIAAVAAAIAVALHFIARSRPLAEPLPTARFIPRTPVHARSRSMALTDVLLLAVRIAALLAIGLAVAAPAVSGRGRVSRIVLLDRSRAVANIAEARDSVRTLGSAAAVIPFDSTALGGGAPRSIDGITATQARGSLSAALARAIRFAATLPASVDSAELDLVSPVAQEELDAATLRIRAAWPGRIRVIPVRAAASVVGAPSVTIRADSNDAVAAGLELMGVTAPNGAVRVVRDSVTAADSTWATTGGHVLVHWPASETFADWPTRSTIDAVGGVASSSGTLVARFPRLWVLQGNAVARWSDGSEAAVEETTGAGCIRHVGILIDGASDVTLHEPFRAFVSALLAPCGGARATTPASATTFAALAGSGPLAATAALQDRSSATSRWTPWLFALGALLLIVELALRRSVSRAP